MSEEKPNTDTTTYNQQTITGGEVPVNLEDKPKKTAKKDNPKPRLRKPKVIPVGRPQGNKTEKVVITCTPNEKEWIYYLAQKNGFEYISDYMLSFPLIERQEIIDHDNKLKWLKELKSQQEEELNLDTGEEIEE